jgi:hypothetical protein
LRQNLFIPATICLVMLIRIAILVTAGCMESAQEQKSQMTAAREKHNKKPHRSSNRRNRAGGCTGTTLTLHILNINGGET